MQRKLAVKLRILEQKWPQIVRSINNVRLSFEEDINELSDILSPAGVL